MAGKSRRKIINNSPLVIGFIAASFIVTLAGQLTGGRSTELLFMTYRSSLLNPLTYFRMFSHVLGHEGFEHFLGNAMYILLLGPMLEEKYKSQTLLEIILITAFVTALINMIFFRNNALCGASGVVFAFILMASFTRFRDGEIPITFLLVAVIYIGQQIIEGITIVDNISNMAHIAGGLIGAISGYSLNKKSRYGY